MNRYHPPGTRHKNPQNLEAECRVLPWIDPLGPLAKVYSLYKLMTLSGESPAMSSWRSFLPTIVPAARRKMDTEENRIEDRSHEITLTWLFLIICLLFCFSKNRYRQLTIVAKSSMWLSTANSFNDLVWLNRKLRVFSLQTSAGCRRVICR